MDRQQKQQPKPDKVKRDRYWSSADGQARARRYRMYADWSGMDRWGD